VLEAIGAPGTPVITPDESAMVDLRASHTASGNPGRFKVGKISVELDAEWLGSMNAFKRAVVTAITARGLARYGYLLRRRAETG